MFLNSSLTLALDRIAERAADVRRAYAPGAVPQYDDVATPAPSSTFTLDPLSVAAPDGAYFVSVDEQGRRIYTRDGSFALRGGTLVDSGGNAVLGRSSATGSLNQLRVDAVDEALGRVDDAAIEPDGRLVYRRKTIEPRSGRRESQRVVVGRIALARFPAATRLETAGGGGVAPDGVTPQIGFAAQADFAALAPMQRERSRVDLDESLIRLKEAYVAFDALQAAEFAKGRLGKTAMDLLK